MPQMQDDAGNIWEVDAQGNPVGLVRAASAQQQGRVFTLPQNPKDAAKDARQAAQDARQAEQDAIGNQIKQAELDLKRQQLAKGQTAGGNQGTKVDQAALKRAQVEALTRQMLDVDQQLRDNFEGANDRGLAEYLPTPTNKAFDSAAAGLSEQALGAFRVPGVGSQSDAELRAFNEANRLGSSNYDEVNRQRFDTIRNRVDETRQALGMAPVDWTNTAGQRAPDEIDKVAAIPDGGDPNSPPPDNSPPGLPPANSPGGQDTTPLTPASGGSRWVADPRAAALVNSLVNAGAGEATINAAMKKRGFDPMPLGQFNAVRNWMRQNPGQRYTGATAGERQPLSLLERAAGSSPGAAVANWADAATAGISTALAGERGRGALDAMRAASPNASAVGGIGGGIVGAGAAELALAARAPAALAQYAPRIADTLYGGLTGFNSANEGEGGMGALIGGGAGLAGGFIGERAMRGAGAAFRGITDPAAQTLRARGVPLTVGQAVGNSGRLGEFVKNTEDAMTSIPVVGGMVNARRLEGLRGFNEAAFDVAGTPIAANVNNIGSRGLRELADARTQAYRAALDPVTIDTNADPQMIADLAQARLAAQAIPNVQPTMPSEFAERSLENRIQGNIDPNGLMSGRNFQEGYRGLARDARGRATADYGHEIGEVARQGQDVLSGALERQNPGAFEAFRAANATNRNAMTLADAVNRAKNTLDEGDEIFTPAQLNIADTGSSRRLTGPMASATGNRPFYDLAQAGQSVLPSKLPDSGTASRMMTGLALGGLAGAGGAGGYALGGAQGAPIGTGLGLGAALALALGGTRGAQNVAVRGLLDRPDVAITIGEELRRRAALGGVGGAGILAQIVAGQ